MRQGAVKTIELLGVIPKTARAEVRVTRQRHKGREVLDIRVWWLPPGANEFVPSRKGVAFDASKVDDLLDAIRASA